MRSSHPFHAACKSLRFDKHLSQPLPFPMPLKLAKLNNAPEIFHTLQGEGINSGVPAVFIRSSLCNLHCQWCDTDYTWNWEHTPWKHDHDHTEGYNKFKQEDYIIALNPSDIFHIISKYNCNNLVLTGGEPLLQQEGWVELLEHCKQQGSNYYVEIETNGTKIPNSDLAPLIQQFNVSPKLSNSGNAPHLRYNTKVLRWFQESGKAVFKFVIQNDTDLEEVTQIVTDNQLDTQRVLLMPEGRTPEILVQRRLWLADICRDHGYRFCDRLHVQLWGSKRGV